jgi:hypothetical protein
MAAGASSCQVRAQREANRKEEETRCHKELGWHPGRAHVRYVAKEKQIERKRRRAAMRSCAGSRGEIMSGICQMRREEEVQCKRRHAATGSWACSWGELTSGTWPKRREEGTGQAVFALLFNVIGGIH